MLKKLVIPILILFSSIAYAKLDENFLNNELVKVTSYNLKNKIYTFHLRANNFSEMTASEYSLNLKNVESFLSSDIILNDFNSDEMAYIHNVYNDVIKGIYHNFEPKVNSAVTFNFKVNDSFFTMISIPNLYYENYSNCEGVFILFDSYVCFELDDNTNSFISKYLKRNFINSLSSDFMSKFTIVHEYSHTLPEQLRLKKSKIYNAIKNDEIKKDIDLIHHYNEVYSDIYAGIRLLQLGHEKEELDQVIFMRNLALYLYKDTIHFSSPYIKSLKNLDPENYMSIKSFEEIDRLINKIFIDVINRFDTTNHKLFYAEKVESKKALADISKFVTSINRNLPAKTFKIKTQSEVDFIAILFDGFIRNTYYASRMFYLDYPD